MARDKKKMASETSDPGHPQPEEAEVESARLLANDARDQLGSAGLSYDEVRTLADGYVALGLVDEAGSAEAFSAWAREHRGQA